MFVVSVVIVFITVVVFYSYCVLCNYYCKEERSMREVLDYSYLVT